MSSTPSRPRRGTVWTTDAPPLCPEPLRGDAEADACVIGAGIAGLTTAYLLAREGRSVIVLDDGPVGGGMTSMTSAHLASALDDRYVHVEKLHGREGARLAAESHSAAIDIIESIAQEEGIDCDFLRVDGFLFLGDEDDETLLDRELEAAHRAGLTGVEKLARAPGAPWDTGPCLRFPRQGQFHPMKYLTGLAEAVRRHGGAVHCSTRATVVEDGAPCSVTTTRGVVTAPAVVVATNVPFTSRVAIPAREAAYMTYLVAARVPRGSVAPALYWDTADPYHYVRVVPGNGVPDAGDGDLLLVGGEDHRTGHDDEPEPRYARLAEWARARVPSLGDVVLRWSGQVVETMDGVAFIGRNPGDENVFVITGDSGMGLTHGTLGGRLVADLVAGRENPWSKLYDPTRFKLRAAGSLIAENAKTNARYAEHVTPGDVSSLEEIARGCGAVMLEGGKRLACYRDDTGALHRMSAICPHLGCVVHWNRDARTWDCPCHGSRFDPLGTVVNGPANTDLAPHGD